MKKLLFFLFIVLVGCKTIFDPIANSFIKFQQTDTCKKVLIAKVIDYRIKHGVFPLAADSLSSYLSASEFEFARKRMLLPDSLISDSTVLQFQETWNQSCPKQFDTISFISYQTDSIDIITQQSFHNDTSYSILHEKRRLTFANDTFSKVKHYTFDIQSFNNNSEPIDYLIKK